MRFNLPRQFCISHWKNAGALQSPKGMQLHSKKPKLPTVKVVHCFNTSSIFIIQNPDLRSKQEKCSEPTKLSNAFCILGSGWDSIFVQAFKWQKSTQNHNLPYFFCTNTTALHQALWLGLMTLDSNISHRWLLTSSTNGGGIHLNHSLKGVSLVTFMVCSVEWVEPTSAGSNENTSWYLARSQHMASASSGVQESRLVKSNSSSNLPSLCLTVSLGVWESWDSSAPSSNCSSSGGSGPGVAATSWPLGFSFRGSASMSCYSLPPWLPFYCLSSTQCMCSTQRGPVARNHPEFTRLVPWC